MATTLIGPMSWSLSRDDDGYREYKLPWKIKASRTDGPFRVLNTAGLPLPGAVWAILNDFDPYVWCRPNISVQPFDQKNNEPTKYWMVEQTFSNKPYNFCTDEIANPLNNPLLIPFKKSGSFVKYTEEATLDRFGRPVITSSHELIHGPGNEWDANRPQVTIEQNVPVLQLGLVSAMVDALNDRPLWGLPRRCVKLSNFTWEERYYGQCFRYFNRRFEFDVRYPTRSQSGSVTATTGNPSLLIAGFDRELLDEGTKALSGDWNQTTGLWDLVNIAGLPPDPSDPTHYKRFKDRQGENCRVILNGRGLPYNPTFPNHALCDPCDQSPQQWIVRGFDVLPLWENLILNHSGSDCEWSGTPSGSPSSSTMTLDYSPGNDEWSISTGHVDATGPWRKSNASWKCMGSNTLLRDITGTGPDAITVSPYGGNAPGSILVQKYNEANFYLLGIPAILG